MLLTLDIGNTHIVVGAHRLDANQRPVAAPLKSWRFSTHPVGTGDEFRAKLQTLLSLEGLNLRQIQAAVASSVVPSATTMLRYAFADIPLHIIDKDWSFSFAIKTDNPAQIGADRLVNAEAAIREYGAPVIVVDSGTATTLCAINRDREYLGGAIITGIELSIEVLSKRTAKLFSIELAPPKNAIGRNTEEALKSGIILGYASMIDGMVRRFKEELGEPNARVVATGGISTLLKGICTELNEHDPDLTLKGILYLHDALEKRPSASPMKG